MPLQSGLEEKLLELLFTFVKIKINETSWRSILIKKISNQNEIQHKSHTWKSTP